MNNIINTLVLLLSSVAVRGVMILLFFDPESLTHPLLEFTTHTSHLAPVRPVWGR